MRRIILMMLCAALVLASTADARETLTPGMVAKRNFMVSFACTPTLNHRGETIHRTWKTIVHRAIKVRFQKLGYRGCAFVHMKRTGYVPVCVNYREDIYARLVSGQVDKIDEAITLIEIKAMQLGLIPYSEPDVYEKEEI